MVTGPKAFIGATRHAGWNSAKGSLHQDSLHRIEGCPFFCGDVVIGDREEHEIGYGDVKRFAYLFHGILGGEGFIFLDGAQRV